MLSTRNVKEIGLLWNHVFFCRRLFWTESLGRVCTIMTANMDGTNRTKFVSNRTIVGNSAFTSLSVDYVTRR